MSDRRDTKRRLLETASLVFADKGYRGATVQDLCRAAGVNVAAVSYHYGSKDGLYLAVWKHAEAAFRAASERIGAIDDPRRRLAEMIRFRIRHIFDDGLTGCLRRLVYHEMADPSQAHGEVFNRFVWPQMAQLTGLVAAVLEVSPDDPRAGRCAFSIQSQMVFLHVMRIRGKTRPLAQILGSASPTEAQIRGFAEHLVTFAAGGLAAVRRGARAAGGRTA